MIAKDLGHRNPPALTFWDPLKIGTISYRIKSFASEKKNCAWILLEKKIPGITFNAQKHLCIKQELVSMIKNHDTY